MGRLTEEQLMPTPSRDAQHPLFSIRIQREYPIGTWSAQPLQYDMGDPIGYGKTIQEAIENFIEAWELKFDEVIVKYRWIAKQGMWG